MRGTKLGLCSAVFYAPDSFVGKCPLRIIWKATNKSLAIVQQAAYINTLHKYRNSEEKMQNIWMVKLRDSHPEYTEVRLKRSLPENDKYTVVIVDADRLLACYSNEIPSYVLPPVHQWPSGKEKGIREFLNPSTGTAEMPRVSFVIKRKETLRKHLWGLLKPVVENVTVEPVLSFTNGRHRAVYMAYAGALYFPVEIHISEAELLRQYCGSADKR